MKRQLTFLLAALTLIAACTPEDKEIPNYGNGEENKPVDPPAVDPPKPAPKTILFDAEFLADGTARDKSDNKRDVETVAGPSMLTYYNEDLGQYVAHFNHTPGTSMSKGYFKIPYNNDNAFMNKIADGHSMEVVFRLDAVPGSAELKMFSSMQAGGTGFLISAPAQGSQITFLPNVSPSGASNWTWTRSSIKPERGRYYHVIGVWDKEKAESRIYIDGELKAQVAAEGKFNWPSTPSAKWFCIGGDPSGATAEAAWKGDVAVARIYDEALSEDDVKEICKAADYKFKKCTIELDDLAFLTGITLTEGSKFGIRGNGWKQGDKLRMQCGDYKVDLTPTYTSKGISVNIPAGMKSGVYQLIALRGNEIYPFGSADLTIGGTESALKAPKVIAHRGFHKNGIPENSIASLAKAQEDGYYGSETDVWITTDGEIYINHDGTLGGVKIQDNTSETVGALKLSNGEAIPTFSQYLAQAQKNKGTKLIIEIKQHSTVERDFACTDKILDLVKEAGMDEYVEYISFSWEVCKRIAQASPSATVGYLSGNRTPYEVSLAGIKSIDYSYNSMDLNPKWISEAHSLGMIVNVWTVNNTEDLIRWICLGADYITTDNPDVLTDLIADFL